MEYVVLDIETTGLSRYMHKITEIAAVKVKDDEIVGEFQTLVDPETRIPKFITRLTGIDNDMVKDAPKIKDALQDFLGFLGPSTIVAHSATFDYGFISHNAEEHLGIRLDNERLCTRKLANRLLPDLGSKRLGSVCEHLNITNEQAHRAMGDVKATTEVFKKFLELMHEAGLKEEEDILRFERSPIRPRY